MVGLYMGTRNRTKTSVLSALGFIYATSVLVFQFLVPFHISSDSFFIDVSLEINFMTACVMGAAFSDNALLFLCAYLFFFAVLIVLWFFMLFKKRMFYGVLLAYLIADIVYITVINYHFDNWFYCFLSVTFKIIGCVLCVIMLKKQ